MAVKNITSPLDMDTIRDLEVGDQVAISGRIITARDQVHAYLTTGGKAPVDLEGIPIYHCGPLCIKEHDAWRIVAAGPTTSMREEPFEPAIIRDYRIGAVMGKGGMGQKTLDAMQEYGCVYLHIVGGAAAFIAQSIKEIRDVYLLEFGRPEAMWDLVVKDLPALVTMDSHGKSLHARIEKQSRGRLLQQKNSSRG
ncbi:MAG: FumA C-terminus/TtdB family hydratase beta subunit [Thermodesulfobacteriota bacterium]|nr:FumA C-terminus/TtdB family hydratase beta subunit [Thermodesulfobacteriota bacterium]